MYFSRTEENRMLEIHPAMYIIQGPYFHFVHDMQVATKTLVHDIYNQLAWLNNRPLQPPIVSSLEKSKRQNENPFEPHLPKQSAEG